LAHPLGPHRLPPGGRCPPGPFFAAPPTPPGLAVTVAGEEITSATPLEENQQVLAKVLGFETVSSQQVVTASAFSFSPQAVAGEKPEQGREQGETPGWPSGAVAHSPPSVDKRTASPLWTERWAPHCWAPTGARRGGKLALHSPSPGPAAPMQQRRMTLWTARSAPP